MVFVSAAAGAVGQIVCQIAKLKGGTVIGSAGGAEKCAYLKEIGVDHVIDYKADQGPDRGAERAAPKGIDVYFDNVGGDHLEAALNAATPVRPLRALRRDLAVQRHRRRRRAVAT